MMIYTSLELLKVAGITVQAKEDKIKNVLENMI